MNKNRRIEAIWERTVEKMKEVVREFEITQDELHQAGDFFNRLGQAGMCRSLIDVALAMTSVDVTARTDGGTRPNLEGPYHSDHPVRPDGNLIEKDTGTMPRLTLTGTVRDADTGTIIPGAKLDFWQADNEGHYDVTGTHLRGIVTSDAHGRYRIHTLVPRHYSDHDFDPIGELFRAMGRHNSRAAHIHLKVDVGGAERLTTQIFIPGCPYLATDYVEGAVSEDLVLDMIPVRPASETAPAQFQASFDVYVQAGPAS